MLVNNFVFRGYKSTSKCANLDIMRSENEKLLLEAPRERTEKVIPTKTPPPNDNFERKRLFSRHLVVFWVIPVARKQLFIIGNITHLNFLKSFYNLTWPRFIQRTQHVFLN